MPQIKKCDMRCQNTSKEENFLDFIVIINRKGKIDIKVLKKPNNLYQYLPSNPY